MRISATFILLFITKVCFSQSIVQAIYGLGGFNNMGLGSINEFPDSTLFITGSLSNDIVLFKIDTLGNQLFSKTFGDSNYTETPIVTKLISENKLLIVGFRSQIGLSSMDVWISKIDSFGILDWSILLSDSVGDSGSDFYENADSSFMVLGGTNRYYLNYNRSQSFVANLSPNGNVNWVKKYGKDCDSCETTLTKMLSLTDSTFLLYGSTSAFSESFSRQKLIVKIDLNGNIIWSKLYSDNCNYSYINKIIKSQNNNLLVLGNTCVNDTDILLMEIDSSGAILWNKKYSGATGSSDISYDIVEVENNNYLFCGNASLSKVDTNGNLIWSSSYILSPFSNVTRNILVHDNQYFTAGTVLYNGVNNIYIFSTDTSGQSCNFTSGNYNIGTVGIIDTLVNIDVINHNFSNVVNLTYQPVVEVIPDSIFCQSAVGIMDSYFNNSAFKIYPNPCMDFLNVQLNSYNVNSFIGSILEIYDVYGRKIINSIELNGNENIIINTTMFKSGIYLLNLKLFNNTIVCNKFIKL